MKCCCSPYAAGITIGSLYIVGAVIVLVFELIIYYDNRAEDLELKGNLRSHVIEAMTICGITALISSLFIVAIVKRCHYLILPWLLLNMYVFYATLSIMYWWFIGAGMGGASGLTFIVLLFILVASIAIEITIFCFSISLFKKIRMENIHKSERAEQQMCDKNLI